MGFSPLVNTLQFLQGVNARETCASFWTARDVTDFKKAEKSPCGVAGDMVSYTPFSPRSGVAQW